jgi:hypothetical protein
MHGLAAVRIFLTWVRRPLRIYAVLADRLGIDNLPERLDVLRQLRLRASPRCFAEPKRFKSTRNSTHRCLRKRAQVKDFDAFVPFE